MVPSYKIQKYERKRKGKLMKLRARQKTHFTSP